MKKPKKIKPRPPAPSRSDEAGSSAGTGTVSRRSGDTSRLSADAAELAGEPTVNRAAVPVLLIAFLATMVYFGDMYVVDHGGELDARVHQPFHHVKELEYLRADKDPRALQHEAGKAVYTLVCAGCHQADGSGSPSQDYPPLAGSDWVNVKDPSRLIRIVLNGLGGPITVSGKQYGRGVMVVGALSDEQIALALSYVRSEWKNNADEVTPDQVKKVREEIKGRTTVWSVEELLKVPLKE
jgi:mono/diheme cytochrome c family protein